MSFLEEDAAVDATVDDVVDDDDDDLANDDGLRADRGVPNFSPFSAFTLSWAAVVAQPFAMRGGSDVRTPFTRSAMSSTGDNGDISPSSSSSSK